MPGNEQLAREIARYAHQPGHIQQYLGTLIGLLLGGLLAWIGLGIATVLSGVIGI